MPTLERTVHTPAAVGTVQDYLRSEDDTSLTVDG